jgi:hypothetical protein
MSDDERDERRSLVARKQGEASWTGRAFLTVEWNSTDMWNLDIVLAGIIADGLNEFRRTTPVSAPGMSSDEWDAVPGEMIDGFAAVGEVQADGVSNDEAGDRVERALELFKRHFLDLGS